MVAVQCALDFDASREVQARAESLFFVAVGVTV